MSTIHSLLTKVTHWQNFKDFFQITVLKYLVTWFAIVPFFAILFYKIPTQFKIDILHTTKIEYVFNFKLPFTWQLLWFSSLFFVIAYFLYLVKCPKFIKKYNSFADYVLLMHSPRWLIWESKKIFQKNIDIEKFFQRITTKKYVQKISLENFNQVKSSYNNTHAKTNVFSKCEAIVEEKQTKLYFMHGGEFFTMGLPILKEDNEVDKDQTQIVVQELFWEVFGRYSSAFPIIRLIILILLIFSTILFLIVLFQNIISGIRYVI